MRKKESIVFTLVVAIFLALILILLTYQAQALPSFARKYETSCQTCHVAFPKLNAFGEAFRNSGYRFPGEGQKEKEEDEEEPVKQKPVALGAPAWKKVWPKAVWPSDIPPSVPAAFLMTSTYNIMPDQEISNDFVVPNEVDLFTGGTLGESFSFYGGITLLEQNEFGGLHRLFGQFHQLFGTSLLNVRFGAIEPRYAPFSSHRRLMLTNYAMNQLAVNTTERSLDTLVGLGGHAHGSGPFSLASSQRGIELWGATSGPRGGGLEWAFGVTNGNGLGGFAAEHDEGEEGHEGEGEHGHGLKAGEETQRMRPRVATLDDTSGKDIYARLSYKFFGLGRTGLTGQGNDAEPWVDDSVRVGLFAVRGAGRFQPSSHEQENYRRYGVDLDLWFKNLNFYGAYMFGNNEREDHEGPITFDLNAWFVEADYVLLPWVIPALRYEVADVKPLTQGNMQMSHRLGSLRRVVPHVTLLLRANVKLAVEANRYFNGFADEMYRINLDFSF